jgi:hypothetical protein
MDAPGQTDRSTPCHAGDPLIHCHAKYFALQFRSRIPTCLEALCMSRSLMKVLRTTLTVVAAAGALGVGLLLASLWLEHNSSLELPRPTGPFAVGRVSTTWVDTGRLDPFAPAPAQKRELVAWIWYPARPSDRSAPGGVPARSPATRACGACGGAADAVSDAKSYKGSRAQR